MRWSQIRREFLTGVVGPGRPVHQRRLARPVRRILQGGVDRCISRLFRTNLIAWPMRSLD
jgi:hypothetical protein